MKADADLILESEYLQRLLANATSCESCRGSLAALIERLWLSEGQQFGICSW